MNIKKVAVLAQKMSKHMNIATFIIPICLFSLVDSSFLLKRVVDIATFIIPICSFTLASSLFLLKRAANMEWGSIVNIKKVAMFSSNATLSYIDLKRI